MVTVDKLCLAMWISGKNSIEKRSYYNCSLHSYSQTTTAQIRKSGFSLVCNRGMTTHTP